MSSRRRDREGRHLSIGGAAADEVLESLVQQFSDRYTFIRELIQNSLDAGAARIEVRMSWDGRELRVEVKDDGEGMDRPIIEGYLLTLFRSTKEEDLTKIGKFGIGFTSIFAMDPLEVVVDTGRDGVWHRVTFDEGRSYTLSRLAEPYEGTTVTLRLPRGRKAATEDVQRVRDAALKWCRFADAAITTSAEGTDEEWPPTPVAASFTVDAPVVVSDEVDGMRAVLGPHAGSSPPVGWYNRGITLWEGDHAPPVPAGLAGVTFRVAGRHLEHTLTRDNVIRDRHFSAVQERLEDVVRTRLADAVHAEAEAAARDGDPARAGRLFAAIAETVPWAWRDEAPLLPGHGRTLSLADLRGAQGWLARLKGDRVVWWGAPGSALVAAVAESGVPVVLAHAAEDPHVRFAARHLRGERRDVATAWGLAEDVEAPDDLAPLFAAARNRGLDLRPARFSGAPLQGRVAVSAAGHGLLPAEIAAPRAGHALLVHVDHPLVRQLAALPAAVAAPLLAHAARVAAGLVTSDAHVADAVARALGGSS